MKLGTELRNSAAFRCIAAAAVYTNLLSTLEEKHGMPSTYVHHIANEDDNCTSYDSYKYLKEKERVDEFMSCSPGAGAYGYWSFGDGSKLVIVSSPMGSDIHDRYVVIQNGLDEEHFKAERAMIDVTELRVCRDRKMLRSEAVEKEPVAEQV